MSADDEIVAWLIHQQRLRAEYIQQWARRTLNDESQTPLDRQIARDTAVWAHGILRGEESE